MPPTDIPPSKQAKIEASGSPRCRTGGLALRRYLGECRPGATADSGVRTAKQKGHVGAGDVQFLPLPLLKHRTMSDFAHVTRTGTLGQQTAGEEGAVSHDNFR